MTLDPNSIKFDKLLKQTNIYLSIVCRDLQDFLDARTGSMEKLKMIMGELHHPFNESDLKSIYEQMIGKIIELPRKFNVSYANIIGTIHPVRKQLKILKTLLGKESSTRFKD